MFKSQLLLLAALLLATDVFAARITYSAKYKVGDKIERTSKLGTVPDDKVDLIVEDMKTWSNDKYTATASKHAMIVVANVETAASKGKASEEVQDMQSIVNKHIKDAE